MKKKTLTLTALFTAAALAGGFAFWQSGNTGPNDCRRAGDICASGMIYAGQNPDTENETPLFIAATAAPTPLPWREGKEIGAIEKDLSCYRAPRTGMLAACFDGPGNTAKMAASPTPETSPYLAARYCDALVAHGHDDWHLPSYTQIQQIYNNRGAIGGFEAGGGYWSASTTSSPHTRNVKNVFAWLQYFSRNDLKIGLAQVDTLYNVRCVR